MADRLEFHEKLKGILELAARQNSRITTEEVERYFKEEQLSQEQIELVYDYLMSQKIIVKGYEKENSLKTGDKELKMNADEEAYLKEYLNDLKALKQAKPGEKDMLFGRLASGDTSVKARLTEVYLEEVVEIAKELYHPEIFFADLVQEGNVNLMLALERLTEFDNPEKAVLCEIRQGIRSLIEEQTEVKKRGRKMVEKVSALDEAITKLTDELGHKVTFEELMVYMDMSEQEIKDIMRLAGEEAEEG